MSFPDAPTIPNQSESLVNAVECGKSLGGIISSSHEYNLIYMLITRRKGGFRR